ncbi:hypothetical protein NL108_015154 [Boleophthalmus pectinirostris]|nr:hypothetical protein NL108_015154 [Boleophthalmus pectinirostris]
MNKCVDFMQKFHKKCGSFCLLLVRFQISYCTVFIEEEEADFKWQIPVFDFSSLLALKIILNPPERVQSSPGLDLGEFWDLVRVCSWSWIWTPSQLVAVVPVLVLV